MKNRYTIEEQRRIVYLLNRLGNLKNGHTLSPCFTENYPFFSHIDRFGELTTSEVSLKSNFIYKFLENNPKLKSSVDLIEVAWQYYLVYGTTNGSLFKYNTLFENMSHNGDLFLIHVTNNLKEIKKSGHIYPSGGCLGASLYVVPLRSDGRIHNLAKFIYTYELPNSLKAKGEKNNINLLVIKVNKESFISSNEEINSLDYLLMGKMQLKVYNQIKRLSIDNNQNIFSEIEKNVWQQIEKTRDFLNFCVDYKITSVPIDKMVSMIEESLINLPFLGYVYFEVLLEYVTLFQDDRRSMLLKEKGEVNNYPYKKMIFDICPGLLNNFKLTNFNPKLSEVIKYMSNKSKEGIMFVNFSSEHFLNFFIWRFAQYVRYKIMDRNKIASKMTFEKVLIGHQSLVGHLLHRETRNFPGFKNSLYDQRRASEIWRLWNDEHVVIPFNSIVPKGEVGLNPFYKKINYQIFSASFDKKTDIVKIGKELPVTMIAKLTMEHMQTMRHPYLS